MDTFLGTTAFRGDTGPETSASTLSLAGQARFDGVVVFTNWSRSDVQAVLPPGLELAENMVAPDLHPVVFIVGEQVEGALIFGGFTIPTGIGYHEIGIGVPFVQHGYDPRLHTFIARMYSSYFPAVWNGNAHYGFAKQVARMWREGAAFVAVDEDRRPLLHIEAEPAGDWTPGGGCPLANFEAMRAIFTLPVLGRRADGGYICSRFDWVFGDALVRPAVVRISIDASLGRGLTPRRCAAVPEGAFDLRGMLWRLSWPAPCQF